MKRYIFVIGLVAGIFAAHFASAHGNGDWKHGKHGRGGFMVGVCVGQTLAQQGIILPAPTPGQRPNLDAATQAAFKAAVDSCRATFKAAGKGSAPQTAPAAPPTGG